MKILHVCLSRDLPDYTERLSNYIYFTYDHLSIYFGSQDAISDNFAIVENMPEEAVDNMIYIVMSDGTLHQYIDYTDTTIAQVEDPSMIELIRKAGTTFFVNGDGKYIERVRRSLVLPFNNGVYEMAVGTQKEDKFDNDTIIKFNEKTGKFELFGEKDQDYIDYDHFLKGVDTTSVHTDVNSSRLFATVILSKAFDNALKVLSDGLYVRSDNKVSKEDFDRFLRDFKDFKAYAYAIFDNLEEQIQYVESIISYESVSAEILNQLRPYFPTIETAIDQYADIRDQLEEIETEAMTYCYDTITGGIREIEREIEVTASWDDLTPGISDYTHEVDYYDKDKEWSELPIAIRDAQIIASIAIYSLICDHERELAAVTTTAIEKYKEIIAELERINAAVATTAITLYNSLVEKDHQAVAATSIEMYESIMAKEEAERQQVAAASIGIYDIITDKEEEEAERERVAAASIGIYDNMVEKEKEEAEREKGAVASTAIAMYESLESN